MTRRSEGDPVNCRSGWRQAVRGEVNIASERTQSMFVVGNEYQEKRTAASRQVHPERDADNEGKEDINSRIPDE